jgi:xanthine dehydrogenase accessory factor
VKNLVFQALGDAAREGEPVTLGIISGVKGSSPQKVGAKALFYADGRIKGTLGGGCLEAEIQQRAVKALRTGESETFDLLLDHDFGWDDGLICGGKVFGVILPNAQKAGQMFWQDLAERQSDMAWGVTKDFEIQRISKKETRPPLSSTSSEDRTPTPHPSPLPVLPVRGEGNSSVRPANHPRPCERTAGTISPWSSSHQPAHPRRDAAEKDAESHREFWYVETVTPPSLLWIAGAGHIAQAVAPLAAQLDFEVTVFDDRPALANRAYFPEAISLRADTWDKLLASELPARPSFALIVTRGHRHDALVLKDWIRKPFLFIGMIGSARKSRTIFEHFIEERIATLEDLNQRVACPVGIKIRSQSVPEIAVSIMAQFIDKRAELLEAQRAAPAGKLQLV